MSDIANNQKNTVGIENITSGNDLVVNSDGSIVSRLNDGAGSSVVKGQTTMAGSLPVVIASNQTSIPVTTEGQKQSYSSAASGITLAASATDVFTIKGSETKTIRITRIAFSVSTTAGSGIGDNITLVKRSTANTGGTSTTLTNVPHDSNNAAGTATVQSYTANPTLGTSVGAMRAIRSAATTTGTIVAEAVWDFGIRPAQGIALRGTAEQLCINLGSVSITNPVANMSVEWTEE